MKIIRRVLIWIVFPILIQMAILYYINDYFFSSTSTIHIKKILSENSALPKKIEVSVPSNAQDIKASYDGKYVSYILNNNIVIIDTKTLKVKKLISGMGRIIDNYTWLTDRNRLLYFSKANYQGGENIQLQAYDLDANNYIKIDKLIYVPIRSHIANITLSPLTNMIYINVVDNYKYSRLYRVDIMGKVVNLRLPVKRIIKMYEIQKEDELIYESSNNEIRVIKNGFGYTFLRGNYSLIGIDSKDNVYIGKLNNNKIIEIYYGTLDEKMEKWKHITLSNSISPLDVVILPKNDSINTIINNRNLMDIKTSKIINGYGTIIGINMNYIIYKENNKVILKLQ